MNYTEIIEKLNVLNGWVLISVIVSIAAALLAIMCIRTLSEIKNRIQSKKEIDNAIKVLIKEQERYSAAIREFNQKIYKLESLIKEKQNGNNQD